MLSYVEMAAAVNSILALISLILCSFFVYRLWGDMVDNADVGAVGLWGVFVAVWLLNLWNVVIYAIIAQPGPEPPILMTLTVLKPPLHFVEVIGFLLIYLHYKKPKNAND